MNVNQELIKIYEVLKDTAASDFTNLATENAATFTTLKNNITNLLSVLNVADTWDDKVSTTLNTEVKTGIDAMIEACSTPNEAVITPTGTEITALKVALKTYKDNVKKYQDEDAALTALGPEPKKTIRKTIEGSPNDYEEIPNPEHETWVTNTNKCKANMEIYKKNAEDAETVSKAKIQLLQALLVPGGTHSEAIGSLGASYSDLPTIEVEDGGTDGRTYSSKEAAVTMLMSAGIPEEQAIKMVDEDIAAGKIKIVDPTATPVEPDPTATPTPDPTAAPTEGEKTVEPSPTIIKMDGSVDVRAMIENSVRENNGVLSEEGIKGQTERMIGELMTKGETTFNGQKFVLEKMPGSPMLRKPPLPAASSHLMPSLAELAAGTDPAAGANPAAATNPAAGVDPAAATNPAAGADPAAGGNQAAGGTQSTGGNQATSAEPIVINMGDSFNVRAMIENSVRENNGVLSEEGIKGQTERMLGELMTKGETTFNGQRFVLDKMPGGRTMAADPLMFKK